MAFSPMSFLIGLGVGWAAPIVARSVRPLAVELAVAGMSMFDEARRIVAEQVETLEDIAAEARARREDMLAQAEAEGVEDDPAETDEPEEPDGAVEAAGRGRRRGGARRTASNGSR